MPFTRTFDPVYINLSFAWRTGRSGRQLRHILRVSQVGWIVWPHQIFGVAPYVFGWTPIISHHWSLVAAAGWLETWLAASAPQRLKNDAAFPTDGGWRRQLRAREVTPRRRAATNRKAKIINLESPITHILKQSYAHFLFASNLNNKINQWDSTANSI